MKRNVFVAVNHMYQFTVGLLGQRWPQTWFRGGVYMKAVPLV